MANKSRAKRRPEGVHGVKNYVWRTPLPAMVALSKCYSVRSLRHFISKEKSFSRASRVSPLWSWTDGRQATRPPRKFEILNGKICGATMGTKKRPREQSGLLRTVQWFSNNKKQNSHHDRPQAQTRYRR